MLLTNATNCHNQDRRPVVSIASLKCLILFLLLPALCNVQALDVLVPVIDGQWWQVASNPDLGQYTSAEQQPVDFAIWQARDGSWQIWSCIRHTKCGGHTRLFHRWEGKNITDKDWTPKGIAMMAKTELGEPLGGLQAPHVIKYNNIYWMAYGDWDRICMATSKDGKDFQRLMHSDNSHVIFTDGPDVNNRDPILLFTKNKWYCYYTAFPAGHGYVFCRTSDNLLNWTDPVVVAYGGIAGNNPYSAECPHVVEVETGHYHLFRTQVYGPGSQTMVYHSENPMNFGIDDDSYYVTKLNVSAPEIVKYNNQYYIAALNLNLDGIRIAKLKWKRINKSLFNFDDPQHRKKWKTVEGSLYSTFTNTKRTCFNPQTEYFIGTAETESYKFDDSLTGIIESPAFTINDSHCALLISGGGDIENTFVAIVDAVTERELKKFTGTKNNAFTPAFVECTEFMNKKIKIRIVDLSKDSWGHINFAGIYTGSTNCEEK